MSTQERTEPDPLEFLASQVAGAKANQEVLRQQLERLPRWRFKRRAELKRIAERNRMREEAMLGLVRDR